MAHHGAESDEKRDKPLYKSTKHRLGAFEKN